MVGDRRTCPPVSLLVWLWDQSWILRADGSSYGIRLPFQLDHPHSEIKAQIPAPISPNSPDHLHTVTHLFFFQDEQILVMFLCQHCTCSCPSRSLENVSEFMSKCFSPRDKPGKKYRTQSHARACVMCCVCGYVTFILIKNKKKQQKLKTLYCFHVHFFFCGLSCVEISVCLKKYQNKSHMKMY